MATPPALQHIDGMLVPASDGATLVGLTFVADLAKSYEFGTDLGVASPMGIPSRRTVRREPVGVVAAITPWRVPTQINLARSLRLSRRAAPWS